MTKIGMNKGGLLRIVLMGGIALFLAGCSPPLIPNTPDGTMRSTSEPAQAAGTEEAPAWPTETQMTPPAPTPSDAGLQALIEKAKADLAQRLSISINEISLEKATSVVWPNASLGCPQKGMVYAEVLTPGYLIILIADNNEYEYHASRGTEVIYCVNPTPPVPGMPGSI